MNASAVTDLLYISFNFPKAKARSLFRVHLCAPPQVN